MPAGAVSARPLCDLPCSLPRGRGRQRAVQMAPSACRARPGAPAGPGACAVIPAGSGCGLRGKGRSVPAADAVCRMTARAAGRGGGQRRCSGTSRSAARRIRVPDLRKAGPWPRRGADRPCPAEPWQKGILGKLQLGRVRRILCECPFCDSRPQSGRTGGSPARHGHRLPAGGRRVRDGPIPNPRPECVPGAGKPVEGRPRIGRRGRCARFVP